MSLILHYTTNNWLFLNIFSNFYEYHSYIYYHFVSNYDRNLSYIIIQEFRYFTSSLLTLLLHFPLLFFNLSCCLFIKSCLTLCNPMDCSMLTCLVLTPGVCSNSCPLNQWCHLTISSSVPPSPALNLSQHQGLFQWVSSSHQLATILELQHSSFQWWRKELQLKIDAENQWIFKVDFL